MKLQNKLIIMQKLNTATLFAGRSVRLVAIGGC